MKFYVTTPIYYVNDKPHLGSAYSTVNADVLTRYHRLFGHEAKFLTGVDEHGQKVEQAAKARGKTPQEHCDEMAENFRSVWKMLNIEEDIFFRTTDEFHKKAVQSVLQKLFDKGLIYAATYEGWYCVSEEIFYTEKELIDGKTPTGKEVVKITEKNYFFKMGSYRQKLVDYIQANPKFIQPDHRRNEVLGFLKQDLNDLCISRPKSRLSWGIEIPFDKDYVTYVWFDALLNYATAQGFEQPEKRETFEKWWGSCGAADSKTNGVATHLLGKDILITHTVYWPTMLMAMDETSAHVALPKQLFAHGWILNKDSEKMSKSKGSVMDPIEWVNRIGADSLRYFLVNDIPLGQDAPVSHELIIQRVNGDLANNLGNLLSRTTNLIQKFFDGKAPAQLEYDLVTENIIKTATTTAAKVKESVLDLAPHKAIEHVRQLLNETNKFLEDKAPWKTAKTNLVEAGTNLYVALEALRIAAGLLSPIMPVKMRELYNVIGVADIKWEDLSRWGVIESGATVNKTEPLFPRIDLAPAE